MSSSLLLCKNKEPFLDQISEIYMTEITSSVAGPRRSSKALPKAKLAPEKGHCHCLVVCCWSDPWQLSDFRRNHYVWGVCSANRWDALKTSRPAAGIGQQRGPILLHVNSGPHVAQPMLQKLKELGYEVFLSSITFTWPLAKRLLLLPASQQLFQGKCFHNQQEAENAFQEIVESQSMDFYVTGISKLISRWQNSIDFNGSYFD